MFFNSLVLILEGGSMFFLFRRKNTDKTVSLFKKYKTYSLVLIALGVGMLEKREEVQCPECGELTPFHLVNSKKYYCVRCDEYFIA